MKSAILLVDIQNDYFPGGKNVLHQPEQAAAQARIALEHFRSGGLPVFHVRHISIRPGASFFLPDTIGSQIHSSVTPLPKEEVIIKHAPSSFLRTDLKDRLHAQDIQHLVICGMMSHMCIDTTVRAAKDLGFSVTVLEDACTTKDLSWNSTVIPAQTVHGTMMAALNGTFADVITTQAYLAGIGGR